MEYPVTNESNKKCIEISRTHFYVFCEILEDYKSFYDDLEKLIKSKSDKYLVSKVFKYITNRGLHFFPNRKYEFFIEKHKHTIEAMEKSGCLGDFTVFTYDAKGERKKNLPEDYLYQYIEEHKEDFETIKKVLSKIKNLGIDKITFGEHLDFTTMEYTLNTSDDCDFTFLDNMEVTPTYLSNPIRYKTSSSPYCIYLQAYHHPYEKKNRINCMDTKIDLNSLIFDPNKLPNGITIKYTYEVIKGLAEKKKEEYEGIQNSVNLSISTSVLKNEFESLKKTYEKINKANDNQKLKDFLNQMQNIIAQLQVFEENFEQEVIDNHEGISKDIIIKEKNAELDRRYSARTKD